MMMTTAQGSDQMLPARALCGSKVQRGHDPPNEHGSGEGSFLRLLSTTATWPFLSCDEPCYVGFILGPLIGNSLMGPRTSLESRWLLIIKLLSIPSGLLWGYSGL